MPLSPETLDLMRKLGIEIAAEDDPIYTEGATIIMRPARNTRTKEHDEALRESAEQVYREAREVMRAYCQSPEEDKK